MFPNDFVWKIASPPMWPVPSGYIDGNLEPRRHDESRLSAVVYRLSRHCVKRPGDHVKNFIIDFIHRYLLNMQEAIQYGVDILGHAGFCDNLVCIRQSWVTQMAFLMSSFQIWFAQNISQVFFVSTLHWHSVVSVSAQGKLQYSIRDICHRFWWFVLSRSNRSSTYHSIPFQGRTRSLYSISPSEVNSKRNPLAISRTLWCFVHST